MEWEDAEARLEDRSRIRREQLERRHRRRLLLPWLVCPLLAAAAAAVLVVLLRDELRSGELAPAAACLVVPAALAGWVGRHHGRVDAVLWALITPAIVVALASAAVYLGAT